MATSKDEIINATVKTLMADGQHYATEAGDAKNLARDKFQRDLFSVNRSEVEAVMTRWQAKDPDTSHLVEIVCGKLRVTDAPYSANSDPQFTDLSQRVAQTASHMDRAITAPEVQSILPELTAEAAQSSEHLQMVSCFSKTDFQNILRPLAEHKPMGNVFAKGWQASETSVELHNAQVFNFATHANLAAGLAIVGDKDQARAQLAEGIQHLVVNDRAPIIGIPKIAKLLRDVDLDPSKVPGP